MAQTKSVIISVIFVVNRGDSESSLPLLPTAKVAQVFLEPCHSRQQDCANSSGVHTQQHHDGSDVEPSTAAGTGGAASTRG
ncbi:hypothetical protein Pmani_024096 [Petrolisthes manimaculis]|uniref:Uncharacterized protein n=1 Tax=Petrolisthes manimaculis TaxID=1843537 RepID=A0AAE1PB17_9EUCA|nr:hypothetical protein Pmani_024096 [Petrolisthes manimaculis]